MRLPVLSDIFISREQIMRIMGLLKLHILPFCFETIKEHYNAFADLGVCLILVCFKEGNTDRKQVLVNCFMFSL